MPRIACAGRPQLKGSTCRTPIVRVRQQEPTITHVPRTTVDHSELDHVCRLRCYTLRDADNFNRIRLATGKPFTIKALVEVLKACPNQCLYAKSNCVCLSMS